MTFTGVYSLYILKSSQRLVPWENFGPILSWLAISSSAAFLQLLVLFARLFYLERERDPELYDSAILLTRRFRRHFLARLGLLILGSFILPLSYVFYFLSNRGASGIEIFSLAALSFVLSLSGEILGRYLFFVTVVPKNMPGSFFTESGGSH